jgi:TAT (twin-arginine translocation) pathway signal sequence
MSRRSFLRATGVAAAGTAIVEEARLGLVASSAEPVVAGPGVVPVTLTSTAALARSRSSRG